MPGGCIFRINDNASFCGRKDEICRVKFSNVTAGTEIPRCIWLVVWDYFSGPCFTFHILFDWL